MPLDPPDEYAAQVTLCDHYVLVYIEGGGQPVAPLEPWPLTHQRIDELSKLGVRVTFAPFMAHKVFKIEFA